MSSPIEHKEYYTVEDFYYKPISIFNQDICDLSDFSLRNMG